MKRTAILLAAIGLSAFAGAAPASAQYNWVEMVHRYYNGSHLVATVEFWCDGSLHHHGGEITGNEEVIETYYGCP